MFKRSDILKHIDEQEKQGRAIIGAGAGTGISAKSAEGGDVDLIIIYNSGRYRMAGRGSLAGLLPYGDANAIVKEMASEVLPVVKNTPVLAGVCGTDPFRIMDKFLQELKTMGFSGVQNFPTVGLIDGTFRDNLEETDMSYDKEVEMIEKANSLDLLTTPYVFNEKEAEQMATAGADILVAHMGLTTKGTIGAKTSMNLEEAAHRIQKIADTGKKINSKIKVICHGGPISEPEDAHYILENTQGVIGFFGASSIERLPTEQAIKQQTKNFKNLQIN
ncbi:phosphoenolpyruvate hydrolase family protein [Natranaerobius thermophilus]|uniref:Transcriptional regulator n=1 Tax=Natranaerobius thermophilus (strain ATCC BAA-1301 / DSM 18059 / JW/NM-WN-LF) TaxID=457570 RepID=B2A8A0_NATTJ|nr:phosphoenolpyruvate hydrolase family protein [Natranaerobius thermophilus]ACB84466.1 transcriptional regulator [Natranaerobius thermophilus JW/NM-WN-LF]